MGIHSKETLRGSIMQQSSIVALTCLESPWPPCHGKGRTHQACPSSCCSHQEHCRACHRRSAALYLACSSQSSRPGRHSCQRGALHSVCTDQRGLCQGSQGRLERTSG